MSRSGRVVHSRTSHDRWMIDRLEELAEPFPTREAIDAAGLTYNKAPETLRRLGFVSARSGGDARRLLWARTPIGIERLGNVTGNLITERTERTERRSAVVETETVETVLSAVPDWDDDDDGRDHFDGWVVPVPADLQAMANAMRLGIEVRVWPLA